MNPSKIGLGHSAGKLLCSLGVHLFTTTFRPQEGEVLMLIGGVVTVFASREEDDEYEEGTEDIQNEDEEEVMPSLGDSRGPQGPHAAILTRLLLAVQNCSFSRTSAASSILEANPFRSAESTFRSADIASRRIGSCRQVQKLRSCSGECPPSIGFKGLGNP